MAKIIYLRPTEVIKKNKAAKKATLVLWSWGDSNSRPDEAIISFLHAYPVLSF